MTGASEESTQPTVLVDATLLHRRMKGVGRYAWHLCEALDRGLPLQVALVLAVFDGEVPDFPKRFRGQWVRLPYRSEIRLGLKEFPKLIRQTRASVFVRPADKIGKRYSVPTLTVCHDINPLIWAMCPPRPWSRRIIDNCWERLRGVGLRQSDRVICNSEFIRKAATHHFGVAWNKTSVGYCGVDRRIPELAARTDVEAVRQGVGADGFLLSFATGDEREGFRIMPQLWAATRKAGYPGRLVIAGVKDGADYACELRRAFRLAGETNSVLYRPFLGERRIGELAGLYRAADFYLETSRHEGFGMQLVEAMASGTTCFSSGRGALEEVGGGFPLPLDIELPAAAGAAVATAWQTGQHRRNNSAQVAHALSFNWESASGQVVEFCLDHLRRPNS